MLAIFTGALRLLPLIVTAIKSVEALTSKKGKDKQDAAVAMVGDLLPLVEETVGRDLINNAQVQDAVRKVIDAIVALQNVIRDVTAKSATNAG